MTTPPVRPPRAHPGQVQLAVVRAVLTLIRDGETFTPGDILSVTGASPSGVSTALIRWSNDELMLDARQVADGARLDAEGWRRGRRYTLRRGKVSATERVGKADPCPDVPANPPVPSLTDLRSLGSLAFTDVPREPVVKVIMHQDTRFLLEIDGKAYLARPYVLT